MLVSMSRFLCLLRDPEEPVNAMEPMAPDLTLPRLSAPELLMVLPLPLELPLRLQLLLILFISPPWVQMVCPWHQEHQQHDAMHMWRKVCLTASADQREAQGSVQAYAAARCCPSCTLIAAKT